MDTKLDRRSLTRAALAVAAGAGAATKETDATSAALTAPARAPIVVTLDDLGDSYAVPPPAPVLTFDLAGQLRRDPEDDGARDRPLFTHVHFYADGSYAFEPYTFRDLPDKQSVYDFERVQFGPIRLPAGCSARDFADALLEVADAWGDFR
jgi:hypothetical protein